MTAVGVIRRFTLEHDAGVGAFAFHPSSNQIITGDRSGVLTCWSLEDGEKLASTRAPSSTAEERILALAVSPDGKELAVSEPTGMTIRDASSLNELRRTSRRRPSVLQFGARGTSLLVDGSVLSAVALDAPEVFFSTPRHAAIDVGGDTVLIFHDGGYEDATFEARGPITVPTLTLFAADRSVLRKRAFAAGDDAVTAVTFDRATQRFVFATAKGEIAAWSSDGAREDVIARLEGVERLFCVEGASAAFVGGMGGARRLLWWKGRFAQEPVELSLPDTRMIEISNDGKWLAWQGLPIGATFPVVVGRPRRPFATRAQIQSLGFAWPPDLLAARAATSCTSAHGDIDLEAVATSLADSLRYARRSLDEMYAFARQWNAPVDETTDRRAEMSTLRDNARRALAVMDQIAGVAEERSPLPDVPIAPADAERARLMRAIVAAPQEDAPRLGYAKLLGPDDLRAALIRVQCEAASLPEWHPRREALESRAYSLSYRRGEQWAPDVLAYCKDVLFRRGFVEGIVVDPSDFPKNAAKIFELEPLVCELHISGVLMDLPSCPELARIRMMRVKDAEVDDLVRSPHVRNLRELWVEGGGRAGWYEVAARSGTLASLESVALWNASGSEAGIATLAGAATLPRLAHLWITNTAIARSTLEALGRSPLASRLASLAIDVGIDEARALAAANYPALETLRIGTSGTVPAAEAMPSTLSKLVDLCLDGLDFDLASARALGDAQFGHLRSLRLTLRSQSEALDLLASAPWFRQLEHFRLAELAAREAARSFFRRMGPRLRSFWIGVTPMIEDLEALLASSPEMERIRFPVHQKEMNSDLAGALEAVGFTRPAQGKDEWLRG